MVARSVDNQRDVANSSTQYLSRATGQLFDGFLYVVVDLLPVALLLLLPVAIFLTLVGLVFSSGENLGHIGRARCKPGSAIEDLKRAYKISLRPFLACYERALPRKIYLIAKP